MLKLLLFIIFILNFNILFCDEFDNIINYYISNSLTIISLSNNFLINNYKYQNKWLDIIPRLAINSGYNINNNTNFYYLNISFTKDIIDFDAFLCSYLDINRQIINFNIEQELRLKYFISTIIDNYSDILYYYNKLNILNKFLLLYKNIDEITKKKLLLKKELPIYQEKLSNIISIYQNDIELYNILFNSKKQEFILLIGEINNNINLENNIDNLIDSFDYKLLEKLLTNNTMLLQIKQKYLNLTNNLNIIQKKWREIYLPTLNLYLSFGYDILNTNISYSLNSSLSFGIFDIFNKLNDIKIYELNNKDLFLEITNMYIDSYKIHSLMQRQIEILSKRIQFLTENQNLNINLLNNYFSDYENNILDFIELNRRISQMYEQELELINSKIKLFIIQKRIKYGILNSSINKNYD